MTDYEYDEDLPYVVVEGGRVVARTRRESDARYLASGGCPASVIDTTPKPRVPADAKFVTWLGEGNTRWYAERRDGVWILDDGDEADDMNRFPDVTPDTVFTVLDERKI